MILAISIGNADISFGCFQKQQLLFIERLSTDLRKTELEYAISLKELFRLHDIAPHQLAGVAIASVVPPLSHVLEAAVRKILPDTDVLLVDASTPTGLQICVQHPEQLGTDLIVGAVAALAAYHAPVLMMHLAAATTISVIDREGCYRGGAILPGVKISLQSLVSKTAQLPNISLSAPKSVIGKNTVDSMKSGLLFGNAATIDGMIDRIWQELGYETALVATGEMAEAVIPLCRHRIAIDPALHLKGLQQVLEQGGAV